MAGSSDSDSSTNSSANTASLGLGASNADTEIGKIIVDMGLATRTEIEFCREQQKQSSDPNQRSLAELLIENSFITTNQAKRIRAATEDRGKNSQLPGYQLLGRLGKGAMATVYKARQVSLDRVVAIKVLPRKLSENPEFVDRFYREGKAAARLSHNNIVQAIDVGCAPDGYHYFVMEYIEGKTLYDIMQEGHTFSEAEALDIGIQMADALAHAHQRQLIHRDVKPKNIILTPGGVAKLTDLGLARATDDKLAAEMEVGKAYGTPYYISPEQIRGELDIDFRADIYSLGATIYHLVTGRPPFEGETPAAVMHKHLKQALTPADHVNTALTAGIGEVIDVAMAKKREERYQSTEDMLEDLRALRAGNPPVHARKNVDLDALEKVEESAQSVEMPPIVIEDSGPQERSAPIHYHGGSIGRDEPVIIMREPKVVAMLAVLAVSLLVNIVLIYVLLTLDNG